MNPSAALPITAFLVVVTVDLWVYRDARNRQRRGNPATVAVGSLRVETPEAWFLGCLLLVVVFVPLYLTATGRNPFARRSS
ncbi:hypothetical protein [Actinoplanes sp. NPDC049316]|uniref:hypothetical protein n=1 Tax=Actinoplanes sp. NPDC049316 TaxID=3154727 RepID=UPI0034401292